MENPYDVLIAQAQNAKNSYDQSMATLMSQFGNIRQQAMAAFQPQMPPVHPAPGQQYAQPTPPPAALQQAPGGTPPPGEGIPPHIQILSVLGEIKEVLEKIAEKPACEHNKSVEPNKAATAAPALDGGKEAPEATPNKGKGNNNGKANG